MMRLRLNLRAEGPLFRTTGEGRADISPRTSSVVSRTCEPKPTSRTSAYCFNCERYSAYRFAFYQLVPRVRRCFRASFRLAPCCFHHKTLRSSGGQGARCVRPTSATCLILRLPVPRAFPAHSAAFTAWTSHGVLGSVQLTRGPSASRHPRTLRRITTGHTLPCLLNLSRLATRELSSVGVLSPRRPLRSCL